MKRIAFLGTPDVAVPVLRALAKEGDKARQTLRPLVDRDGAQGPQAEARKLLAELDR